MGTIHYLGTLIAAICGVFIILQGAVNATKHGISVNRIVGVLFAGLFFSISLKYGFDGAPRGEGAETIPQWWFFLCSMFLSLSSVGLLYWLFLTGKSKR